MVVLLIIGIIIGFATLSIDTREEDIALEAQRFAALVNLSQEEAVLKSHEMAVEFNRDGYRFLKFIDGKWQENQEDEVLRSRELLEGVSLELSIEGEHVTFKENFSDQEDEELPRIYLLSSGESTLFEIVFQDKHTDIKYMVIGDPMGGVRVLDIEMEE